MEKKLILDCLDDGDAKVSHNAPLGHQNTVLRAKPSTSAFVEEVQR